MATDADALAQPGSTIAGAVIENFVFTELTRQLSTSALRGTIHFYRDRDGREIDFILERRDGTVVALEVKSSASVRGDSFKHMKWLRDKIGDRFHAGYVIYLGKQTLSFGDRMYALPLSALWGHRQLSP